MNLQQQVNNVAAQGRYGDSMLMHVNPAEVHGLSQVAPITINPETGQPEAFLPFLAPIIGSMLGGSAAFTGLTGLSSLAGSALGSGLAQWAATGDIKKGLLAGLTGYGIGSALQGAAGAATATAGKQAATSAATEAGQMGTDAATEAIKRATTQAGTEGFAQAQGATPWQNLKTVFGGSPQLSSQVTDPLSQLYPGAASPSVAASSAASAPGMMWDAELGQLIPSFSTAPSPVTGLDAAGNLIGSAPPSAVPTGWHPPQVTPGGFNMLRGGSGPTQIPPGGIPPAPQVPGIGLQGQVGSLAAGAMQPGALAGMVGGMAPTAMMESAEEWEEEVARREREEEESRRQNFLANPEPILYSAGGGPTNIDESVLMDANLLSQQISPSRRGFYEGGDSDYSYSGSQQRFTPARQSYDINPQFMAGFQPETMYFQPNTINQPATATTTGGAPVLEDDYLGSKGGYGGPGLEIAPQQIIDPYAAYSGSAPPGLIEPPGTPLPVAQEPIEDPIGGPYLPQEIGDTYSGVSPVTGSKTEQPPPSRLTAGTVAGYGGYDPDAFGGSGTPRPQRRDYGDEEGMDYRDDVRDWEQGASDAASWGASTQTSPLVSEPMAPPPPEVIAPPFDPYPAPSTVAPPIPPPVMEPPPVAPVGQRPKRSDYDEESGMEYRNDLRDWQGASDQMTSLQRPMGLSAASTLDNMSQIGPIGFTPPPAPEDLQRQAFPTQMAMDTPIPGGRQPLPHMPTQGENALIPIGPSRGTISEEAANFGRQPLRPMSPPPVREPRGLFDPREPTPGLQLPPAPPPPQAVVPPPVAPVGQRPKRGDYGEEERADFRRDMQEWKEAQNQPPPPPQLQPQPPTPPVMQPRGLPGFDYPDIMPQPEIQPQPLPPAPPPEIQPQPLPPPPEMQPPLPPNHPSLGGQLTPVQQPPPQMLPQIQPSMPGPLDLGGPLTPVPNPLPQQMQPPQPLPPAPPPPVMQPPVMRPPPPQDRGPRPKRSDYGDEERADYRADLREWRGQAKAIGGMTESPVAEAPLQASPQAATDVMQDPITQEVVMFLVGETDNQQVVNDFIAKYGNEMFLQLRNSVLQSLVPGAETEGQIMAEGQSGMSDDIPGMIGSNEKIAVSQDEFIVPADVVSGLGDGSSDSGSDRLYEMMDRVRQAKTGGTTQPPRIDPNKMMPA